MMRLAEGVSEEGPGVRKGEREREPWPKERVEKRGSKKKQYRLRTTS
jgi:hypothetical protein